MTIVQIAHTDDQRLTALSIILYDRYTIKLHARAAALAVRALGRQHRCQLNHRISTVKADVGFNKKVSRGIGRERCGDPHHRGLAPRTATACSTSSPWTGRPLPRPCPAIQPLVGDRPISTIPPGQGEQTMAIFAQTFDANSKLSSATSLMSSAYKYLAASSRARCARPRTVAASTCSWSRHPWQRDLLPGPIWRWLRFGIGQVKNRMLMTICTVFDWNSRFIKLK